MRLFARLLYGNGNRNGSADHRVVAHADQSHHFHVRGNGGGACKLGVAVHPAHGIRHAIGSGTSRHVVGMQRAACAAAGSNGEVVHAVLHCPLLVCACNEVLEAGGRCV